MKTAILPSTFASIAVCATLLMSISAQASPIQTTIVANTDGTIRGQQQMPLSANLLTTASESDVNYLTYGTPFGGPPILTNLSLGTGQNGDSSYSYQNFSVTYALDLTGAEKGFDLTGIKAITSGQSNYAGQFYTLSYELVGSNTFTTLGSFGASQDTSPAYFYFQALQTSITDSTGTLASGIDAIRFDLNGGAAFVELEAIGAATTPEPGTWAMTVLGLGALGVLIRRRAAKIA